MLATLTKDYFSDEKWLYERKLDGELCLLYKKGKEIKMLPELVAEIGFAEWTSDGKLRHSRFLGLRKDKSAKDIYREGKSD